MGEPFDFTHGAREKRRMELNDLTREERIALVALLEVVVESDAVVSDEELDEMQHVVAALGDDAYREAVDEANRRFRDENELKAFLPAITRQEAREVIYGTVLEAAIPDAIGAHESAVLDWLGKEWRIGVRVDEADAAARAAEPSSSQRPELPAGPTTLVRPGSVTIAGVILILIGAAATLGGLLQLEDALSAESPWSSPSLPTGIAMCAVGIFQIVLSIAIMRARRWARSTYFIVWPISAVLQLLSNPVGALFNAAVNGMLTLLLSAPRVAAWMDQAGRGTGSAGHGGAPGSS